MDDEQKEDMKLIKKRLRYCHKFIILHEIIADMKTFQHLKDPDLAKDY